MSLPSIKSDKDTLQVEKDIVIENEWDEYSGIQARGGWKYLSSQQVVGTPKSFVFIDQSDRRLSFAADDAKFVVVCEGNIKGKGWLWNRNDSELITSFNGRHKVAVSRGHCGWSSLSFMS